jgi:hypothetical protein
MNERRPNAAGRHGACRGRGRHIRGRGARRGRRSPSAALAMTQEAATTSPNPLGRIVVMDYRAPHRWALPRQLKAGHGRRPA